MEVLKILGICCLTFLGISSFLAAIIMARRVAELELHAENQDKALGLLNDVITAQSQTMADQSPLACIKDAKIPTVGMSVQNVVYDVVVNEDHSRGKIFIQLNLN